MGIHPRDLLVTATPPPMHQAHGVGVGVGVEKLNSMCVQFSAAENEQMFAVKRAFDSKGLLNPGKVIPTLNRCAEYGKMLVRGGKISHPDLPRF